VPELSGLFSGGAEGDPEALKGVQGQSLAGLAIGAGAFVHIGFALEAKEGLDLTDDFATGTVGFEDLIEEGKESTAHAIDAIPAIGTLVVLGKKAWW